MFQTTNQIFFDLQIFPPCSRARCLVTKTSLKAFSGTRFLACGGFSPSL